MFLRVFTVPKPSGPSPSPPSDLLDLHKTPARSLSEALFCSSQCRGLLSTSHRTFLSRLPTHVRHCLPGPSLQEMLRCMHRRFKGLRRRWKGVKSQDSEAPCSWNCLDHLPPTCSMPRLPKMESTPARTLIHGRITLDIPCIHPRPHRGGLGFLYRKLHFIPA